MLYATMLYEIENIIWDVICFSETKVKESKIELLDEHGYKLFLSGNDTSRSNGVGFLVNKSYVPLIDDYQAISDRLAVLTLKTKFSKITLIQRYLPTSSYSVEDITDIYNQIEAVMDKVPKKDHLFLGDFNAKLGDLNMDHPTAVGKHTIGKANERGELLSKFCTRKLNGINQKQTSEYPEL